MSCRPMPLCALKTILTSALNTLLMPVLISAMNTLLVIALYALLISALNTILMNALYATIDKCPEYPNNMPLLIIAQNRIPY